MSLLSILGFSLFFGLMAGAAVDKSHILPVALITAIILYVSRDKIAAREPAALSHVDSKQNSSNAEGYYVWPELGQFAVAVAGDSFQSAINQLLQENAITPDENSTLKTHILTAHLIPDNESNEVRVDINDRIVGYLNSEQSLSFRRKLDEKELSNQVTSCNAIIMERNEVNGKTLNYGIWLDIELLE